MSVKAFAPATVANVGPAFDVLGFAVEAPGDVIELALEDNGLNILEITGDNGRLPLDPELNTATVAISALQKHVNSTQGMNVVIHKQMPLGSGLGSSAASTAAALVAANEILQLGLSRQELVPFAMEGEKAACGVAHADNVAPAILGGFVLIRSYLPVDIIKLPTPNNLWCVVVHPEVEIRTEDARRVLKKHIPLSSAVYQWGNIAGIIASLYENDLELLSRSLVDHIIEPERSLLIPGFSLIKGAALNAGALACSISGSGPSIFSLCAAEETAQLVAKSKVAAFNEIKIEATAYVSKVNPEGARII